MQTSNIDLRVYNDRQVCKFLGISKRTVAELRATGNLPFVRLGRKRVGVRHADLARYLRTQFVSESGRRCSMTQEYLRELHRSGGLIEITFDSPMEQAPVLNPCLL